MTGGRVPWLPRVYPLTDVRLAGLAHARIVAELQAAGARLVQIRDKRLGAGQLCEAVRAARRVPDVRLIVNDRLDVALAAGADGVHLGDRDLPVAAARRLAGEAFVIGVSSHSVEQALRAQEEDCDYVALGPVYATATKTDARPAVGLDAIRRVSRRKAKPLVAIGGITLTTARDVLDAGADTLAVVSAVMVEGEIGRRFRELVASLSDSTKR